ncbi:alpha/beta-hydrolase [Tothia fuscella]|uniref:Alpha/beta-hydrolase n=1 Tax=Tothia fuscella TaxID=1048955 RepID=A0A9P4NZY4_9PEZI|nr:alpha/beta-hydrolase [Tothia fuscella]
MTKMRFTDAVVLALFAPLVLGQIALKCSELHLIYARATTEPPSGMSGSTTPQQFETAASKTPTKGFGAAGFSLLQELTKLVPALTAYPVNYPADWSGCSSETKGVNDILTQLSTMAKACPNQKYVLGGHSQGAVVTTSVASKIPKDLLPRVIAVTMFGAPPCPEVVKGMCRSYCNKGDDICDGSANAKSLGKCSGKAPGVRRWFDVRNETEEAIHAEASTLWLSNLAEPMSPAAIEQAQEECSGAATPEKGHVTSGYAKSYNRDAFYTKAAACYIFKRLKGVAA